MSRRLAVAMALTVLACRGDGAPTTASSPSVITGQWRGVADTRFGTDLRIRANVEQRGTALTGLLCMSGSSCFPAPGGLTGTVIGKSVDFVAAFSEAGQIRFGADLSALPVNITGGYTVSGGQCGGEVGNFSLQLVGSAGQLAECSLCASDDDCACPYFCTAFSDGSRRCGSGLGATVCR